MIQPEKIQQTKFWKSKWFLKYILILVVSIIITAVFVPYGIYHYIIFTYTDYKVIDKIPPFTDFPKIWSFDEGKIINKARETYIFPDDPLVYQVTVNNPGENSTYLTGSLLIYKGGVLKGDPIKREWIIHGKDKFTTEIEFFLKEEGTYKLEYSFVFNSEKPGNEHPNHAFSVENIQVQSLSDKLLADANIFNLSSYVALVSSTVVGNIISLFYLRKKHHQTAEQLTLTGEQLILTKKELESRLRAELDVSVGYSNVAKKDDKWEGIVQIIIRNNGTISARNIRVYFKDPTSALDLSQLIRDENEIKEKSFSIPGSIPSQTHYPEHIEHKTILANGVPYDLAVWVTYDYADVKNIEFIQIIKINGQSFSDGPLYENEDIVEEKKRLKTLGFLK